MSFYSQEYAPDPQAKYKHYWKHFEAVEGTILDIGCTTGNFTQWRSADMFGVDLDLRSLSIARQRGQSIACANLDQGLCFADSSFAAVNCVAVLEHVAEPLLLLREIHRVLRPRGKAVILVPDIKRLGFNYWRDYTHRTPFLKEGLRRIAIDAGFEGFAIERHAFNYLKHLPGSRRPGVRELLDRFERLIAGFHSTDLVLIAERS